MFKPNALYYTDGYKPGHKKMLAKGTTRLYGTWIPRSLKYAPKGITKIVSFGQQLIWRWIHDMYEEDFFALPLEAALKFGKDMSLYLGMEYDASHFEALHKLGYLPMKVKAIPEGIETTSNIPHMTFINTVDGFGWLSLYLETIVSALAWKPSTSATIALQYRRNVTEWVMKTDPTQAFLIPFMCHDFSARGLDPWSMLSSGLGHASSFRGSDSIICIPGARYFYGEPEDEVCINSVNASEHSVSTTKIFTVGEEQMLHDWLIDFPKGIFSAVMDTMDLTKVVKPTLDGTLVKLKEQIMTRDGKLVIRPDSCPNGLTPADIICGHSNPLSPRELEADWPEFYHTGLIQSLWDIFGGTVNEQGYKVLDSHIGAIYGDSITLDIQVEIYDRLEKMGFATTNIVLGVGSFTYQFNTRDTFGWAAKGSWFEVLESINAEKVGYDIYKDPKTDGGNKRSLKGLLCVIPNGKEPEELNPQLVVMQQCNWEEEEQGILQLIYLDGKFPNPITLTEIRNKLN